MKLKRRRRRTADRQWRNRWPISAGGGCSDCSGSSVLLFFFFFLLLFTLLTLLVVGHREDLIGVEDQQLHHPSLRRPEDDAQIAGGHVVDGGVARYPPQVSHQVAQREVVRRRHATEQSLEGAHNLLGHLGRVLVRVLMTPSSSSWCPFRAGGRGGGKLLGEDHKLAVQVELLQHIGDNVRREGGEVDEVAPASIVVLFSGVLKAGAEALHLGLDAGHPVDAVDGRPVQLNLLDALADNGGHTAARGQTRERQAKEATLLPVKRVVVVVVA
ncbi:hypothetical protein TYRP_004040 [Tyrophagus putrescentiae]|nr:hypothetical protein TYRP_004040 [Tyrophagus putrescentiae]